MPHLAADRASARGGAPSCAGRCSPLTGCGPPRKETRERVYRQGPAILFEGGPYRVVTPDYHPGQGKMGGVAHAGLENLDTGTLHEISLRAELRLQEVDLEKHTLEFLCQDGGHCCFMIPRRASRRRSRS